MRVIVDIFALIGLCSCIIAGGFWLGYTTYKPQCRTVAAVFTKECK